MAAHHAADAAGRERRLARPAHSAARGAGRRRPAGDVEEHLLEVVAAVAAQQLGGRALVDQAARACSISTLRHSRSTSAMLCEASSIVARVLALVALEVAAHPVGGVGIERGRGLVEQQQLGPVDQRLGQHHAGLLPGRQPAGRAVEQLLQIEVARASSAMRASARSTP